MTAAATLTREAAEWIHRARRARGWRGRAAVRDSLTPAIIAELRTLDSPPIDQLVKDLHEHPFHSFRPRPDDLDRGDEQTGFIDSQSMVSIALGGNGSGKTYCAALKAALYLCERQPPPRPDTPFWILGPTLEDVAETAWVQKLSTIIPPQFVDWERITWHNVNRNHPRSVPLKPWAGHPGKNWTIVFKSYDQGRDKMQAVAIGGAWFTEQFDFSIFEEVFRGYRECAFPGGIWAEFTPLDPEKSVAIEDRYEKWITGDPTLRHWSFYHLNTTAARDAGHVKDEWYEAFAGGISDEMRDTRLAGAFASYSGTIYRGFKPKIHLREIPLNDIPHGVIHKRSIDWGSSEEHPLVCLWGYKDSLGVWWIYDEYWSNDGNVTYDEHVAEIKERHPWPVTSGCHQETYGDKARPDLIREFTNDGIPITACRNEVYEGIERVRLALKGDKNIGPKLYIDPRRCPKLARQMKTYRWFRGAETGRNPEAGKPKPLKNNDDAADALRYLIFTDYVDNMGGMSAERIVKPYHASIGIRRRQ